MPGSRSGRSSHGPPPTYSRRRGRSAGTLGSPVPCPHPRGTRGGISASPPKGRNPKEAMRRVLLALMGAAERVWRDARRRPQPGQSGRPLHDRARLLQQPARTRGRPPDPRGRGAEHAETLRRAQAIRRKGGPGPVPGSHELLRRGRADLAGRDRQGGRGAEAPRPSLPRPHATGGLRDRDQHDLGGPGHSASGADAGLRPAEDALGVHPGHQPGGPGRSPPRTGGDPLQRPQTPGSFPLRAFSALPRDLLPLGRGLERDPVRRARPGPGLCGSAGGAGPPRPAGDDAAGRGGRHRGGTRGARNAVARRIRGTDPRAALRGRRRACRTATQRPEPHRRPVRFLARDLRRLPP